MKRVKRGKGRTCVVCIIYAWDDRTPGYGGRGCRARMTIRCSYHSLTSTCPWKERGPCEFSAPQTYGLVRDVRRGKTIIIKIIINECLRLVGLGYLIYYYERGLTIIIIIIVSNRDYLLRLVVVVGKPDHVPVARTNRVTVRCGASCARDNQEKQPSDWPRA